MKLYHSAIETVECTCETCPEQWEGKLKNGSTFYFRFRFGTAALGIGSSLEKAVEDSMLSDNKVDVCREQNPYRGYFRSNQERYLVFTILYARREEL